MGLAVTIVTIVGPLLVPAGVVAFLLVRWARGVGRARQAPGPMTYAEASGPLRSDLSLADKRELLSRVNGQRVRWLCTLLEAYETRGTLTALVTADNAGATPGGQVFFEPSGADRRRIELMRPGEHLVVDGTVRVDLDNSLMNLDAPVLPPDAQPGAPQRRGRS
jgi:hypothetical protein